MRLWPAGGDIWEGQFKDDQLDGFGRWIKVYMDGEHACYLGHWKEQLRHGWGKLIYSACPIMQYEGLWEQDHIQLQRSEITDYDPETDPIAEVVDLVPYSLGMDAADEPLTDDEELEDQLTKDQLIQTDYLKRVLHKKKWLREKRAAAAARQEAAATAREARKRALLENDRYGAEGAPEISHKKQAHLSRTKAERLRPVW